MPPKLPKVSKDEAKARKHVYSSGLSGCGGGSSEVSETAPIALF